MPMPFIYFNYRTEEEKDFVFRIYDRFVDHYGYDNVLIAPDHIPDAAYWEKFILKELDKCSAIVAIVGPRWCDLLDEKRQSGDTDYVVLEITHGLENNKLLTPVRIKNAEKPLRESLPQTIQALLDIQIGEPINADANFHFNEKKSSSFMKD